MAITFTTVRRAPAGAVVVAHGVTTEALSDDSGDGSGHGSGDGLPDGLDGKILGRLGFEAEVGQVQVLPLGDRLIAAVGLGAAGDVSTEVVRRAGAALARAARRHASVAADIASVSGIDQASAARAFVEGMSLAVYRFGYKTGSDAASKDSLARVALVGSTAGGVRAGVEAGVAIAGGVALARDFVNEPGGSLVPSVFANRIRRLATARGSRSRCSTRRPSGGLAWVACSA